MAAKNSFAIDGSTTVLNKSFETGVQEWAFTCGVCHVGGGQMEYDRDMNFYNSDPAKNGTPGYSNTASVDNQYFSFDQNKIVAGVMSDTNKMEVDCLMCHLNNSSTGANQNGAGRAWFQSIDNFDGTIGCDTNHPNGPLNDPTCKYVGPDPVFGLPGAGPFPPGTAYDPENRNMALKTLSFQYGPALGIGAKVTSYGGHIAGGVDKTYRYITGITGTPPQISGANIQSTPASQNCSACHARDDNTPGYPGMLSTVRLGYGNMVSLMPAGTAIDVDTGGTNSVRWIEFGCKTGMGKRGQRIGQGPNDKWGMSMFNAMFGLGKKPGDPVISETIAVTNPNMIGAGITSVTTKERIPDYDVHDKAGLQCATCHYVIGGKKVTGVARNEAGFIPNNADGSATIPAMTNIHGLNTAGGENSLSFGVNYPEETMFGIDHQFAQGDDLKDTYGKNNLDGSVSCEACHIDRTHPKFFSAPNVARTDVDPTKLPPVPAHSGFPALHIEKISCATCHIPEIYVAPFRLKSRDWTLGFIKKGNETNGAFKNIYDWKYDLVTGSHTPITPLHQWATMYEKKQIVPVTPAEMPIWIALDNLGNPGFKDSGNKGSLDGQTPDNVSGMTCTYGSRIFATCMSDADCPGGLCVPGLTSYASPAKTRDVMDSAVKINSMKDANGNPILRRLGGNINTGSIVPLFDGWPFPDGQGVDTKSRIDAMIAYGNAAHDGKGTSTDGGLGLLKIFHAPFDITHGVVPEEWALGGSKRGGCVSCHSSAQPYSYDTNGSITGPNLVYSDHSVGFFEGAQHWMPKQMGVGKYDLLKNPFSFFADFDCTAIVNGLCASDQMCMGMCMGVMGNSAANCQQFCGARAISCSGGSGPQGSFKDSDLFNQQGDPSNNFFLGQCIGFMQPNFDAAMGWPSGTAKAMGFLDGINGLQGFMLRETIDGTSDGCNPFIPTQNVAIMNMGGWTQVPSDIQNAVNTVNMLGNLNNCMPAAYSGTCTGNTPPPGYSASCVGGFRDGKGCIPMNLGFGADADCAGTLKSKLPNVDEAAHVAGTPTGSLLLSRGEARARFDLHLQQSKVIVPGPSPLSKDNINTLWWPILTEQNPSNPNHMWAWDQAGSPNVCGTFQNEPCCTNGMGQPSECGDEDAYGPKNVRTTIDANQLLGYTPEYRAYLLGLVIDPKICPKPVAALTTSVSADGMTVTFNASASQNATSYSWSFGDGATATGVTASHTYALGTYDVTLEAFGPCGVSTKNTQVTIEKVPVAAYKTSVSNLTVTFDGSASLNAVSYEWTFGDGSPVDTTSGPIVAHLYAAGTFNVSLTVTSASGKKSTKNGQITVGKLVPVCAFNVTYDPSDTTKRTIIYNATASINASTYEWTFGDTTSGTGVIVTHPYGAAGTYYPSLKVTSPTGQTCTKSSRIILY